MVEKVVRHTDSPTSNYRIQKLEILTLLRRLKFSGHLTWRDAQKHQWVLFFNDGHIIYATGGVHPLRRWYRYVQAYGSGLDLSYQGLQQAVLDCPKNPLPNCWEFCLLLQWFHRQKLSADQFQAISQDIIADVLFDVVQATGTQHQLTHGTVFNLRSPPPWLSEADLRRTIADRWQAWSNHGLTAYSPNLAPVIQHPEPIKAEVSPQAYQTLMQLLDGQRSLRDLAAKFSQEVLPLVQALLPYIRANWITLVDIADYPSLLDDQGPKESTPKGDRPVHIACVDDSPMVCKAMGQVIRSAGYQFTAVTEGAKAIPILLTKKPDMVFLDLVMPDTNGYEICTNLRKISRFKDIPIVILSGNDGLADQVRARLLGATDFLSKPMEPIVILSIIRKHLGQRVNS
jgi:chemotaxis family two-component system response regulator PixG